MSPHPIERTTMPKKLNHSLYVTQMSKNEIQQSPDQVVYIISASPAKVSGCKDNMRGPKNSNFS